MAGYGMAGRRPPKIVADTSAFKEKIENTLLQMTAADCIKKLKKSKRIKSVKQLAFHDLPEKDYQVQIIVTRNVSEFLQHKETVFIK
jgi:hypothetical protein